MEEIKHRCYNCVNFCEKYTSPDECLRISEQIIDRCFEQKEGHGRKEVIVDLAMSIMEISTACFCIFINDFVETDGSGSIENCEGYEYADVEE